MPGLALLAAARGQRSPIAAQRAASPSSAPRASGHLLGWVGASAATADSSASPLGTCRSSTRWTQPGTRAGHARRGARRARRPAHISRGAPARRPGSPRGRDRGLPWLNALLLRTLHRYASLPYVAASIAASTLAQTAMTIFWTVLALAAIMRASRAGRRIGWVAAAELFSIVIAKLLLVDLSQTAHGAPDRLDHRPRQADARDRLLSPLRAPLERNS